jgi:peptidoglycan-associated lipoprotein
LNLLGVAENQMEAVSLGKEKPKVPNSDDAARAENRRADLIYQ